MLTAIRSLSLLLLYTLSASTFRTPSSVHSHDCIGHRQQPRQQPQPLQSDSRTGQLLLSADVASLSIASSEPLGRTPTLSGAHALQLNGAASALASQYHRLSTSSPVSLAWAQSLLLASAADTLSQTIRGGGVDPAHVAAMGTCASVMSGGLNALWMRALEDAAPGTSAPAILTKSLADFGLCAPVVNSAYLISVPLLTTLYGGGSFDFLTDLHTDPALLTSGWTVDGFVAAMGLNLCTFQPYNLVQFSWVPLRMRPLGGACVSATATVILSGITLR